MLLLTGKTLQETLNDFNKESQRVNALDFNEFLNKDFYIHIFYHRSIEILFLLYLCDSY